MGAPHRLAALPVVLLALAAGACASAEVTRLRVASAGLPRSSELVDVPFHPQAAHQCGPAALASALVAAGDHVAAEELAESVYTPGRRGSLQSGLIAATRRRGYLAYPVSGLREALEEVAAGRPVVVLQNLGLGWFPVWHYAVLTGYDLDGNSVRMHSGEQRAVEKDLDVFDRTWARSDRWGLVVLEPGSLPSRPDAERYFESANGLERAGRPEGASRAYRAALVRWPGSLTAGIGLGNSLYAQGRVEEAARVLRATLRRHPKSGAAHNNLAHVLAELGQREEALRHARRAVALGGPEVDTFGRTLHELEAQPH